MNQQITETKVRLNVNGTDFDDPVAKSGIQAGGFGIENNPAHVFPD